MSTIIFYRRKSTGTELVAIRFKDTLLVIHDDTVATYDVLEYDADEYEVIKPRWTGEHLEQKVREWGARVHERMLLGAAHQVANAGRMHEVGKKK